MAKPTQRRRGTGTPQSPRSPVAPAITPTPTAVAAAPPRTGLTLPGTPKQPQSITQHLLYIIRPSLLLTLLSLATYASRLALRPLYGTIPTAHWHQLILLVTALLGAWIPLARAHTVLSSMAVLCALGPVTAYQVGRLAARGLEGDWFQYGPVIAQSGMTVPLLLLGSNVMKRWLPDKDSELAGAVRASFSTYAGTRALEPIWTAVLPITPHFSSCALFAGTAAALSIFAIFFPPPPATGNAVPPSKQTPTYPSSALSPHRLLTASLPLLLISIPYLPLPPHLPPLSPCALTSSPLPHTSPSGQHRLLAHSDSLTGTLVVAESHPLNSPAFRYLRVDHSLLGGQYTSPPEESIYGTFILQQAVRLVNRPEQSTSRAPQSLVLGLGTGTSAKALHHHSHSITILEIDPLIPTYAREYFSLPPTIRTIVEDARVWVSRTAQDVREGKQEKSLYNYDYVIHDPFTGGVVPPGLYTIEFWTDMKLLMAEDGVVAVSFAGELGSPAASAVVTTLQRVFPNCRAFHDGIDGLDLQAAYVNIVLFCTPSPTPLTFRPSTEEDYLSSPLTKQLLSSLPSREVPLEQLKGNTSRIKTDLEGDEAWVLHDMKNMLDKWQQKQAFEHWKVMRKVLPAEAWEMY